MKFLESLNEPQHQAVVNTDGPSMIIAGAGSGKTRVLTYRIAYLIQNKNVDPFNIMALTFTNKAATEMRKRIEKEVGTDARNLWMGTFHSVFAKILRIESPKIGYPHNFTIYDTEDSKNLIKQIVKELSLDDKVYKPSAILGRISAAKNRLISWQQYNKNPVFMEDDLAAMRPQTGKIYQIYQQRSFKSGAMDFDDLLFNTNVLFKEHPDVLNKYQDRFHYIMVDEFQDTNISQYLITRRLAARRENICVVGDDAQSIYAFRGADIQNILNFEKDYPDLKIFKLEQNYRSTQNIVHAANSVIQKNKAQLKKNVWTSNGEGDLIEIIKATSDNDEGRLVASSIFEEKMQYQLKNKDFAILYRTNSQSRSMEEALRRLGIKYRIIGGLSFYQRKEIKDLLAYLRYTLNQNDEQAFRRIINLPKRGIGDSTVDKLFVLADENTVSIWDVITNISRFMPGRSASQIDQFATMIKSFGITAQKKDAFETATLIGKGSGLLKELYEDKTVEGLSRYENVQELLNGIKEFVDNPEREDKSLGAFLQEVSLLTDADNKKDNDDDVVTMMTIHSAKGLEFKHVYIVGLEEDLFPSQMMLSSRADLEEERRLFYVAITRAEKKLSLSFALTRYKFGRLKNCEPSRFLEEIDPKFLKVNRGIAPREPLVTPNLGKNLISTNNYIKPKVQAKTLTPAADFVASDTTKLKAGMKVEHPKFGFGVVKEMDTSGNERKAKIHFDGFGEKTLLLSFAKLRIHE
jgi:DNA helicase II / ATP-dependent DNA helicase PcrA